MVQIIFTVTHATPIEKRKPTVYEALRDKLGREPSNDKLRIECQRIINSAK
jgi:hypothetical protein